MTISGYPDLLGHLQRNRSTAALKSRLDVASQEAVTGIQLDKTKATEGRLGEAHLLLKSLNDSEQFTRINTLSKTRLDLLSGGLQGARGAVDNIGLRGNAILESNSAIGLEILSTEAEAALQSVVSALNVQHGPRNLLSGAATNQTALAPAEEILSDIKAIVSASADGNAARTAIDNYFNDPAGGFATRIYTGSQQAASPMRIGPDTIVDVDIKANDIIIRQTLQGLATIATAHLTPGGRTSDSFDHIMRSGLAAASNGETGLIALESKIGVYQSTLDSAETRNKSQQGVLSQAYQELIGVDQFEAAAELQQLQVALESSYIITARLSELTLTNYIR